MNKKDNRSPARRFFLTGLSIVEVLISLVIFGLVMGGLTKMIITNKQLTLRSRSRTSAGELARFFLEPLQNQVVQENWGTNCLSDTTAVVSSCGAPPPSHTLDNRTYQPQYTKSLVLEPDGITLTELRRVKLQIDW